MKFLLAAVNAKYIHSNPGIYSLRAYAGKQNQELLNNIDIAEYTINNQISDIVADIYKRKPDVIGFSCYIWNIDYIKSIGALNSVIADVCHDYSVPVYSVDTRCWKSQVIGTSKGMPNKFGVPEEKWPTVNWLIKQGWEDSILIQINGRKSKGTFVRDGQKYMYNNDAADSAGIAMFWFKGDHEKLQLER